MNNMDYVKKVKNLSLRGNLSANWRRFKQNYDIFEEATGIKRKSENVRIASFLNTIGEEAVELFNTFDLSVGDRKDLRKIINAFEKHCMSIKPIILERFKFFSRRQGPDEILTSFFEDLIKMAPSCQFEGQERSLIRDQFVSGILKKELQHDLLLLGDDLNYDKIVELLKILNDHFLTIDIAKEESILPILPPKCDKAKNESKKKGVKEEKPSSDMKNVLGHGGVCKHCNVKHEYRNCPAFGRKCNLCFRMNHFAVTCPNRKTDNFKNPCKKCNSSHEYRQCPAFGKKCLNCYQLNHFAMCCRVQRDEN